LLSFRSQKLETKKKKAFISKGGGLSVSITSKRKQKWQGFGVVEEENNEDDCVKPLPLKRCTPPPKQLPPKHSLMGWRQREFAFSTLPTLYFRIHLQHCGSQHIKTVSFPALGSDQAHSAGSSETRVRQVLGFILAKEQVGSLHLFVANACYWSGYY